MKKIVVLICIICTVLCSMSGCAKKCYDCGKITSRGYTFFGNYYCEDCAW